jgi:membrane protein YqaA with SNARE-associated domain
MRLLILLFATSWAYSIFRFFRRLGPLGLLLLGALDSSFLFLPFGNDLLLIAFVSSDREGWFWILYVLMSAMGSVIGVLVVDLIMRKAGEEGLKRFLKPKRIKSLRQRVEKGGSWAVFTATLLPPPFPFTPVVMVTSALQTSRSRMLLAVFLGRMVRYTVEAVLAIYFGRQIIRYLNSPAIEYFVYALIAVTVAGSTVSIIKWTGRDRWFSKADRSSNEVRTISR